MPIAEHDGSAVRAAGEVGTSAPILETRGVHREFEGVRAVCEVSLSLARGRLTGLIGPNGAGKSTLLGMLAGTIRPTGGRILFEGRDITYTATYERARAGILRTFQLASEFKRLTVLENLLSSIPDHPGDSPVGAFLGPRHWGAREGAALHEAQRLLERFRMSATANDYAGDLSGGQRRLVEIMRALMAHPTLLLLDEPMAGVHPALAAEIGEHLTTLVGEGMTILMVEHELEMVDRLCDPVVVMAEGSLLAQGTMARLRQQTAVVEAYLGG